MPKTPIRYLITDPWLIEEQAFHPERARVSESIFSLANEYMGVRGYFEEGYSGQSIIGSYFNGIFERFYIEHPFRHRGMASEEQKMLNSVDYLYLRIELDGETLDLAQSRFEDFTRVLDMRTGMLKRSLIWTTAKGKRLRLTFERFVSMVETNLAMQRVTFEALNFTGSIRVTGGLDFNLPHHNTSGFISEPFESVWQQIDITADQTTAALAAQTPTSGHKVFSSFRLSCKQPIAARSIIREKFTALKFSLRLKKAEPMALDKCIVNHTEKRPNVTAAAFWKDGLQKARSFRKTTFEDAFEKHRRYWEKVWRDLDIVIEGDDLNQQGIRFCIFNLHQTYHGVDASLNVPAKGLSGDGYDGKTWWDSETYCLPFYLFNNPKAARNLLEYRYKTLPHAKKRAREVDDCGGARYPMSTIDGTETCYVWQHGDLEIHVSAAVGYGIWHYMQIMDDRNFLYGHGIEILLEICRYHADRGNYGQQTGLFGFWKVMGPDEFQMDVNNNAYTNVMAKKIFEYTLSVVKTMRSEAPEKLARVLAKTKTGEPDFRAWRKMARLMKTNFDEKTQLYQQHDGFFDQPHIDCRNIPISEIPIYNHWAYLKIFRYDMLKQPDVLLLLFFFAGDYSDRCKKLNYEYYESRCTHESSLSPAIHSILASELGKHAQAEEFFEYATRIDLDDYNRNAAIGLHVTSMAAAWMNIVQGFGGLRSDGTLLSFKPSIPEKWKAFSFRLLYRDSVLGVRIDRKRAAFRVLRGEPVKIRVFDKVLTVTQKGTTAAMPAGK